MTRDERYDLESYTAIHQGTIFGALTLVTGAIWAKASWGVWWTWSSNQLVLFLVLFLFYCAYFMLRFSIEPGPRRERISAVYALFGVALIPVSFLAIRLANDFIHPTVFTREGPADDGRRCSRRSASPGPRSRCSPTSCTASSSPGKRTDANLRELREALASMSSGEKYVAAAYGVVPRRRAALGGDHRGQARAPRAGDRRARPSSPASARGDRPMAELLVWPALIAYGEAAVRVRRRAARPGPLRAPRDLGRPDRLARADGAARRAGARRCDGFPWGTWAGALNLLVWLVVAALPHLGLPAALPAARPRRDAASRPACSRSPGSAAAPASTQRDERGWAARRSTPG